VALTGGLSQERSHRREALTGGFSQERSHRREALTGEDRRIRIPQYHEIGLETIKSGGGGRRESHSYPSALRGIEITPYLCLPSDPIS
jgi:hypothetical protein